MAGTPPPPADSAVEEGARRYALLLLSQLNCVALQPLELPQRDPQLRWAESGAMWLTGRPGEAPRCSPVPVAACADGVLAALATLAPGVALPDAARLLGERAAIAGHVRGGQVSPGGSCRLLRGADGALAINLPRPDDWQLASAWLALDGITDWAGLQRQLVRWPRTELLKRAALLGLAVAAADSGLEVSAEWCRRTLFSSGGGPPAQRPRVVDLSALWAGPLCGHLLQLLGAEVIKLESRERPDGARGGPADFFDLLNGGKASVALDLRSPDGRAQLRQLLLSADIVIESSRPRALRQMGILAEDIIAAQPGMTWISITGYGRDAANGQRIAYGDDAAVAAGLSAALFASCGEWLFCGDAIADPLTGMHAALAGWAAWQQGGGCLLDISLAKVVRHCVIQPALPLWPVIRRGGAGDDWWLQLDGSQHPVAWPGARPVQTRAAALGADNHHLLPC